MKRLLLVIILLIISVSPLYAVDEVCIDLYSDSFQLQEYCQILQDEYGNALMIYFALLRDKKAKEDARECIFIHKADWFLVYSCIKGKGH